MKTVSSANVVQVFPPDAFENPTEHLVFREVPVDIFLNVIRARVMALVILKTAKKFFYLNSFKLAKL